MSVKGMLFSTDMVRAILDGRKSVTRRVVKPQPEQDSLGHIIIDRNGRVMARIRDGRVESLFADYMPPYRPGDILYVRETFRIDYLSNIIGTGRVHYKADGSFADIRFAPDRYDMMRRAQLKPGWRPNENMPREAARIFLRVTDVRVERLQEISDSDCIKEGAEEGPFDSVGIYERADFARLWDSTIKPADRERYGWAANPWVWVIAFDRCDAPPQRGVQSATGQSPALSAEQKPEEG